MRWTHAKATEATNRSVQPICQRGKLRPTEAQLLGHMDWRRCHVSWPDSQASFLPVRQAVRPKRGEDPYA